MFLNHFRLAIRNLVRDRVYSVINIGGLAVGIAASVLLLLWVQDELSFDRFHKKGDRIFRVIANFSQGGKSDTWTTTPGTIAFFAKQELPEVEEACRIKESSGAALITLDGKDFVEEGNKAYVDASFFRVFDFPITAESSENPFPNTKSIVISSRLAKKYFKDKEAVGNVIRLDSKDDYTITGVIQDMPESSSLRYDILFPFEILIRDFAGNEYWKTLESDWGDYMYSTYVLLNESTTAVKTAGQLTEIHHRNQKGSGVTYTLQPMTSLHLYAPDLKEEGIQTVRIFMIIGIAVLLIACINYINLATARATRRAKEVGVRKTVGANRSKLIAQFLVESAVISLTSLALALLLIGIIIPFYNEISGKQVTFDLLGSRNWLLLGTAVIVTWITAGFYPAIVLSSYQPLQVMRGKLEISSGNSVFRKTLVVLQFALSIAIMVGTLVVGKQLAFIQNKKLGFDKENIFTFGLQGAMFGKKETIKTELARHLGIRGVSLANESILSVGSTTGDTDWEGKDPAQQLMIHPISIDNSFTSLMQLEIIEGQSFDGSRSDSAGFILNETAVKSAGIKNPIGKPFTLWQKHGKIIGVAKDFHHRSMKQKIEPVIFFSDPNWLWLVYVKTNGTDNAGAIAAAEKIWKMYNPAYPFSYTFLDSTFDTMYKTEQRTGKLFAVFSAIAIFISCLGLFGLATFTAAQRIKEIGIRKVMGASVRQIVGLLSRDFLQLIVISLVIAIPVSYVAMQDWLQDFAYRIDIDWTIFAWAGGLSLAIAFLTMSSQTIRAALSNPVESLRND